MIHLVIGGKLNYLREDRIMNAQVYDISPVAIVIDLAKYYHKFTEETFPNPVRFHVNRYELDALHNVRHRITLALSSQNHMLLKYNKNLLSKRYDKLNEEEKILLKKLLSLSNEIEKSYW